MGWGVSELGWENCDHLHLLTDFTQRILSFLVSSWQKVVLLPFGVKFYSPTETGREGLHFSWWLHFKRIIPRSLRKTFLSCKPGKKLYEKFITQKGRHRIYNYKFSKVQALSIASRNRILPWSCKKSISGTCMGECEQSRQDLLEQIQRTAPKCLISHPCGSAPFHCRSPGPGEHKCLPGGSGSKTIMPSPWAAA